MKLGDILKQESKKNKEIRQKEMANKLFAEIIEDCKKVAEQGEREMVYDDYYIYKNINYCKRVLKKLLKAENIKLKHKSYDDGCHATDEYIVSW